MKRSILRTNYQIILLKPGTVDDGKGFAESEQEAIKMFENIMSQITVFTSAKLLYNNKLIEERNEK